VPEDLYIFTEDSYERLADAGVNPLSVTDVLYSNQLVRRHIGAALQVAGTDRHGTWLAVALIEHADDEYTVVAARRLEEAEIKAIAHMRGGKP
jgi:hypothetical protein